MTQIWIRFLKGNADQASIEYDAYWANQCTLEEFRENFIRGWGGTNDNPQGEPCEYVIQDTPPNETTVWNRAPEFQEFAA